MLYEEAEKYDLESTIGIQVEFGKLSRDRIGG